MVSGNIPQESLEYPTSSIPIPYRHGMTIGELARLLNTENDYGAELMIIPMDNWQGQPWSEIGLDWAPISPGISTVNDLERFTICLLYTSPSPRDLSTSRMPSSA